MSAAVHTRAASILAELSASWPVSSPQNVSCLGRATPLAGSTLTLARACSPPEGSTSSARHSRAALTVRPQSSSLLLAP
eukprot:7391307-Prymnesium_polylepis.1